MSQVVGNERLAIQQKLVAVYQERLSRAAQKTEDLWSQNSKLPDGIKTGADPYQILVSTILQRVDSTPSTSSGQASSPQADGRKYEGLIIYNAAGERVYPLLSNGTGSSFETIKEFSDAWEFEFSRQEFAAAAELYDRKARSGSDYVRLAAVIGKSRCLAKLGRLDEAIDECKQAAFSSLENRGDAKTLMLVGNARLLLLNFIRQKAGQLSAGEYRSSDDYKLFKETLEKLLSSVYSGNQAGVSLSANDNLFLARKGLEILNENSFMNIKEGIAVNEEQIRKLIAAEEFSIRLCEYFPTAAAIDNRQSDRIQQLRMGEEFAYGIYHKTTEGALLLVLSAENVSSLLSGYEAAFKDSDSVYRIIDDSGRFVAGSVQPEDKPFTSASVGKHFPGWKIELYFTGDNIFEKAAKRQIAVYTWTGILVIVLIIAAGGFAGQVVKRQIRLNRMKNDFIATVSHELKTPLASMRVLVDTLLEGNYKDQQQVAEYLQMTSKENERLTRLIDNFLTFSRMERNKQVFAIAETSPAAIARSAVEVVRNKFSGKGCRFDVVIDDELPNVSADHDSIVTVLVNLLDNAYKYSYDDKHIELKVFAEEGSVCFAVSDNGIGIPRRFIKKIFGRFYQVDRSLSRRAEGCGLGLSIVKFIVDAHRGSITAESKPGKGSTFTVRLPVSGQAGAREQGSHK